MHIRLLSLLGLFAALALVCSATSDAGHPAPSLARLDLVMMCGIVGLRETARSLSATADRQTIAALARAPAHRIARSDGLAGEGGGAFPRR